VGEGSAFEHLEVEPMQNLIQNHRRLIAGFVVAMLLAAAIVLLIAYSGRGGVGGPY
jgi:ABC-type transporter Mla maintaining outer membrane lipid asymmetry permease subunit MlaE